MATPLAAVVTAGVTLAMIPLTFQAAQAAAPVAGAIAFQDASGHLETVDSTSGVVDQAAGVTGSPAITPMMSSTNETVFAGADHNLWKLDPNGSEGWIIPVVGVASGTSPSIGAAYSSWKVALHGVNDHLWTVDSAGHAVDVGWGVRAGTSPVITAVMSGLAYFYETAFVGTDGIVYKIGSDGVVRSTLLAAAPGTSPAIAASNGYWKIAVHATDGHLWTNDSLGNNVNTGAVMNAGATNPAITAINSGGWEIAYVGTDGNLWKMDRDPLNGLGQLSPTRVGTDGVPVAADTSPALGSGNGWMIAFHAQGDHLWTADSFGHFTDMGVSLKTGTSPAMSGRVDTGKQVTIDPSMFPQNAAGAAEQWTNMSPYANGYSPVLNQKAGQGLQYDPDSTFGIELKWADPATWKIVAKDGNSPILRGQAVAVQVQGLWLRYGHQTWGVNLQFSSVPVFEWYFIGDSNDANESTFAGSPIGTGGAEALWNSSAQAYLVNGHQTFGVDLNWYTVNGSVPSPTPTPTSTGVKTEQVFNCSADQHDVEVWVRDQTAGTAFEDKGPLRAQYGPEGCVAQGSVPITFQPASGHHYVLVATNKTLSTCGGIDDPSVGGCQAMVAQFDGDSNGFTRTDVVNGQTVITP